MDGIVSTTPSGTTELSDFLFHVFFVLWVFFFGGGGLFVCLLFRDAPVAYGSFQAWGIKFEGSNQSCTC